MKFLITILILNFAYCAGAQMKLLYQRPQPTKARVFFLYDREHPRERTYDPGFTPVFINEQLACRLKTRTYTFIDLQPGTYRLASQFGGKKYKARNKQPTELEAKAGEIYYFELVENWLSGLSFNMLVEKRRARELELIIEEKRTIFIDSSVYRVPEQQDPFVNKRFYVRVHAGIIFPVDNYKNWWVSELRPAVNRFQPFSPGFELGVKAGENNHFISLGFTSGTQPSVANPNFPNLREYIVLNFTSLCYSYAFDLSHNNRILLYPKTGISTLNYVRESRADGGGGGYEGFIRLGMNAALLFEYRFSRTFSADAGWTYLHGSSRFKEEKIRLNHHSLLIGMKMQF
jgi:hypothetical protein